MKRGSTKFWLCLSIALTPATSSRTDAQATPQGAAKGSEHRANETLLAGLRPGRDNFAAAAKRFKVKNLSDDKDSGTKMWRDDCSGREIRLELDSKSVIQSVTITSLGEQEGQCSEKRVDFLDPKYWVTGQGLRIGDSQDQIVALYGEPNSSGPATKNGQELALMYYQFDWAGSDVPQVMEVLCARDSGRVVDAGVSQSVAPAKPPKNDGDSKPAMGLLAGNRDYNAIIGGMPFERAAGACKAKCQSRCGWDDG